MPQKIILNIEKKLFLLYTFLMIYEYAFSFIFFLPEK